MNSLQRHLSILNKTFAPDKNKEYKYVQQGDWTRVYCRKKGTKKWFETARANPINTAMWQKEGWDSYVIYDKEANGNLA